MITLKIEEFDCGNPIKKMKKLKSSDIKRASVPNKENPYGYWEFLLGGIYRRHCNEILYEKGFYEMSLNVRGPLFQIIKRRLTDPIHMRLDIIMLHENIN
jgi:hypothetical protein